MLLVGLGSAWKKEMGEELLNNSSMGLGDEFWLRSIRCLLVWAGVTLIENKPSLRRICFHMTVTVSSLFFPRKYELWP